jgi:uncharacterized protein YrrD
MQFTGETKVLNADGEQVGTIGRIIIEPNTRAVTHFVVQGDSLFSENKVVPMWAVEDVTEDEVVLQEKENDLEQFPDFQEAQFVSADHRPKTVPATKDREQSLYWYPPLGDFSGLLRPATPHYIVDTKNVPEGTVPLREGANVICDDGEHIGDIDHIFTDPKASRVTHLLVAEGLFLKEKKLIPMHWVKKVFDDQILLSVGSDLVNDLPEYHPEG